MSKAPSKSLLLIGPTIALVGLIPTGVQLYLVDKGDLYLLMQTNMMFLLASAACSGFGLVVAVSMAVMLRRAALAAKVPDPLIAMLLSVATAGLLTVITVAGSIFAIFEGMAHAFH